MKSNLFIIGVLLLQGVLLFEFFIRRYNNLDTYTEASSTVLQVTISWIVALAFIMMVPIIFSSFLLFRSATKKRIIILFISVLVVELIIGVISPYLYWSVGNPDFAFGDWMVVGITIGLPIAALSLLSTSILSLKFYKRLKQTGSNVVQ